VSAKLRPPTPVTEVMTESVAILDRPKGGRSSLHRRMDKAVPPDHRFNLRASSKSRGARTDQALSPARQAQCARAHARYVSPLAVAPWISKFCASHAIDLQLKVGVGGTLEGRREGGGGQSVVGRS